MGMAYPSLNNTADLSGNRVVTRRSRSALSLAIAVTMMSQAQAQVPHVVSNTGAPMRDNTPKGPQAYRKFGTVKQLGRKQRGELSVLMAVVIAAAGAAFCVYSLSAGIKDIADTKEKLETVTHEHAMLRKEHDLLREKVALIQTILENKGVLQK